MTPCLFIGGVADGKCDEVDDEVTHTESPLPSPGSNRLSSQKYRRVQIAAGKLTIPVFVAGMITDEMALKMLIDGYGVSDATN